MKLATICTMLSLTAIAQSSVVQLSVMKKYYDSLNQPSDAKYPHSIISNTNKLVTRDDREASFRLETKFDQLMYEVEVQIGSNKDTVRLLLDTGSSDLVVNSINNHFCLDDAGDQSSEDHDSSHQAANPSAANQSISDVQNQALYDHNGLTYGNIRIKNDIDIGFCFEHKDSPDTTSLISTSSAIDKPSKIIISQTPSLSSPSTASFSSSYPKLKNTILPDENIGNYGQMAQLIYKSYTCPNFGLFDEMSSESLKNLSIPLQMTYLDGSGFDGYFVQDNLYYAGTKISNMTFGLNINNYKVTGILGVGFQENESSYQTGYEKYNNFPIQLKQNNLIKKTVYSLYSYSNDHETSIIFGGYDKNGYDSNSGLTLVPIINYSPSNKIGNGPWYLSITLNSISVTDANSNVNNKLLASGYAAVLLDIGSTMSTLPYYIFNEILVKFNFKWSSQLNNYVVNEADIAQDSAFLTFDFQSAKINVPLMYFTYPVIDDDTLLATGLRILSITSHDDDHFILGDDFISNVYFVVDLEDKNIALGQINKAKFDKSIVIVENRIFDAVQSNIWDKIYGYNGITSLKLEEIGDPNNLESLVSNKNIHAYIPGTGDLGW